MIKHTTGKAWGAKEDILRTMVKAFLVPKATYGVNYLSLTRAQKNGLEALNREALRVITGLPRCTKVEALYEIGGLNTIEEIAQENKISQNLRLEKTEPGRKILRALGYNNEVYQVFTKPPPPWEDEIVLIQDRPLKIKEKHKLKEEIALPGNTKTSFELKAVPSRYDGSPDIKVSTETTRHMQPHISSYRQSHPAKAQCTPS
ncbi:hypothetical protein HPB47_007312 [Ixodes persulcatus]|uniref:Uncharacterized protein n=1 Tax=Ixodes persulcatus TaxID=34615 RepID=A0AC60P7K7_IXOPE|nr:hypothetical protein HPB47_007312 [Ixodes persulcatus]